MGSEIEPAEPRSELATREAGERLIGGTFAIYAAGNGGLVLVTDVDGRGVEKKQIPKAMVDMFQGKGPFGRMAAKLFGGSPPVGESKP